MRRLFRDVAFVILLGLRIADVGWALRVRLGTVGLRFEMDVHVGVEGLVWCLRAVDVRLRVRAWTVS